MQHKQHFFLFSFLFVALSYTYWHIFLCTLMLHNNMNLDEFAWELAIRNSWWCNIRSHFNTFLSNLHGYWHIFTFFSVASMCTCTHMCNTVNLKILMIFFRREFYFKFLFPIFHCYPIASIYKIELSLKNFSLTSSFLIKK